MSNELDKKEILSNYRKLNKKKISDFTPTSVLITKEQKRILDENNINLSKYLRDRLTDLIKTLKGEA